ncbi:MarR family winged helix-turn-helix transcriptional regulator [Bremerella sp. T1]|uniref:MarR family winged helix-turn-helix transcriptional regulator n=1 Tax=Bremerella sp. TYQ1 TaxID=3119568 RepID=UPI001CCF8D64|nr:MarR family transcriptional regulator [Bremerella volcania]UBM37575.1 MarR family transcriptional regulator [Bremerella volcania]
MTYDFNASTGYWITLASHHYEQRIDAELRPFGITFRQFQVIGWLKYEGPLTQSDLARRMTIEPPTLAGIMARMETMNWIVRANCDQDRRKKYLDVGPDAEPVWEQITAVLKKVREKATAGMAPEEVEKLHELLERVLINLDGQPHSSRNDNSPTISS